mmetsp:Transcript_116562/g.362170  ORF Transcript_116562/g.362170 Transcript_116562/m.362170 type:complete len:246 (-) Transcript_116562:718-1455(-)
MRPRRAAPCLPLCSPAGRRACVGARRGRRAPLDGLGERAPELPHVLLRRDAVEEEVGVHADARHVHEVQLAAEVARVEPARGQAHAPAGERALPVGVVLVGLPRRGEGVGPDLVGVAEGDAPALVADADGDLLPVGADRHGDRPLGDVARVARGLRGVQRGARAVPQQLLHYVEEVPRDVRELYHRLRGRAVVRLHVDPDTDARLAAPDDALPDRLGRLLADLPRVALGVHDADAAGLQSRGGLL